jgi:hypothetical protein
MSKVVGGMRRRLLAPHNNIVIHNKYVLYVLNIIALVILFHLLLERDIVNVIIFFLIGFLTHYFSKNMIIILFTCILVTSIMKYGIRIKTEGMDNYGDSDSSENKPEKKEKTV